MKWDPGGIVVGRPGDGVGERGVKRRGEEVGTGEVVESEGELVAGKGVVG